MNQRKLLFLSTCLVVCNLVFGNILIPVTVNAQAESDLENNPTISQNLPSESDTALKMEIIQVM